MSPGAALLAVVLQGATPATGCTGGLIGSGDWWEALWCGFADPLGVGMAGVGLLIGLGGFVAIYNWAERFEPAVIWLALNFGIVAATVPGRVARMAISVIVIGLFVVIYGLWRRA